MSPEAIQPLPEVMVPIPQYASSMQPDLLETQHPATVEQIIVHEGVPMGPRGARGPTGPTGRKGESTEWHLGSGPPETPVSPMGDEMGDIYLDGLTGDVYQFWPIDTPEEGLTPVLAWQWRYNIMGPTGPVGASGPPPLIQVGQVTEGPYPVVVIEHETPEDPYSPYYAMHFVLPYGATGPTGPPPVLVNGVVTDVGPNTAPSVSMNYTRGEYIIDWWLKQGPTGAEGRNILNIDIVGQWPGTGPPMVPNPSPGDGWVDDNGDVWVWTGSEWVNTGPVMGPVGPTGPPGQGYHLMETTLWLNQSGDTATQIIIHGLGNSYPLVRVLLEEEEYPGGPVFLVDAQTMSVKYISPNEVHVVMDVTYMSHNGRGKVVLM